MYRISIILAIILTLSTQCRPQTDIGLGAQIDFPLLYNDEVGSYNHTLGAFGPRFTFNYRPPNSTFYPQFTAHITNIRLPLVKVNELVVNMVFTQVNFTFNVRTVKQLAKGELHYGLGIGASYFGGKDIELTGNQENITNVYVDSNYIKTWMPAFNLNAEYMFPISVDKKLMLGLGGQLQYIYFFDTNEKLNISIVDNQYNQTKLQASLKGNMFTPAFHITLYYRLGKENLYY